MGVPPTQFYLFLPPPTNTIWMCQRPTTTLFLLQFIPPPTELEIPIRYKFVAGHKYFTNWNELFVYLHSWLYHATPFVPTDIRSHAIFDRAGHSCSHQMTTPDIRAHIKWPPRTFVFTSNYHPGHSCSYQIVRDSIRITSSSKWRRTLCPKINYIFTYFYLNA